MNAKNKYLHLSFAKQIKRLNVYSKNKKLTTVSCSVVTDQYAMDGKNITRTVDIFAVLSDWTKILAI